MNADEIVKFLAESLNVDFEGTGSICKDAKYITIKLLNDKGFRKSAIAKSLDCSIDSVYYGIKKFDDLHFSDERFRNIYQLLAKVIEKTA